MGLSLLGIFVGKTKRPRLTAESWASVDQPSPKCCSRTTVALVCAPVNGSPVPCIAPRCYRDKSRSRKTLVKGLAGFSSVRCALLTRIQAFDFRV